jgi:enoyl-CoA hydratase/carnithine racemase
MTWEMYEGLHAACERAGDDPAIKVVVLRGAGDKAFVAGTDIAQFEDFASGADGVAYEARFTRIIDRLENVDVPTVAAVRGACVGGGLAIAAACDLRVATESARFGVPIARTLRKLPVIEQHVVPAVPPRPRGHARPVAAGRAADRS